MVIFKSQNKFDKNFYDQIIIDSCSASELNSNIQLYMTYSYLTKDNIIRTENKVVTVYDEYVENLDIDFIDKDYVMVDPNWEECPKGFDLYNMETWPEGMVYPDIPKVIKSDYVERTKYFSRLYNIVMDCKSDDEIKEKVFNFISIEEPHYFEAIVGQDNVTAWKPLKIETTVDEKDLDSLKSHKINIIKSMVSNRLLKKYSLIKQMNFMSDSFYSLKTLCGYLGKSEDEIIAYLTSKVGKSQNISDLKKVKSRNMDFSDILKELPEKHKEYNDVAAAALQDVADSVIGHRMIGAMRLWCKGKVNEIVGAQSTDEVTKIMHYTQVPEV